MANRNARKKRERQDRRLRRLGFVFLGVSLTVLALVLMILARRAWGSILVATALTMLGLTVPVMLLDVPGMLAQLSEIAALQGQIALACLGILWGGTAAVLLLAGLAVLGVKAALRRDEA